MDSIQPNHRDSILEMSKKCHDCSAQPKQVYQMQILPLRYGRPCQDVITFAELLTDNNDTSTIPRFNSCTSRPPMLCYRRCWATPPWTIVVCKIRELCLTQGLNCTTCSILATIRVAGDALNSSCAWQSPQTLPVVTSNKKQDINQV